MKGNNNKNLDPELRLYTKYNWKGSSSNNKANIVTFLGNLLMLCSANFLKIQKMQDQRNSTRKYIPCTQPTLVRSMVSHGLLGTVSNGPGVLPAPSSNQQHCSLRQKAELQSQTLALKWCPIGQNLP